MGRRESEPERIGGFSLDAEWVCEQVDEAMVAFARPRMLPRRPQGAMEPDAYWDNRRAGKTDVDGMVATAEWLQRRDETQQWNRSALGALLWAARQYRDVLPEEMHGKRGHDLTMILVGSWGLKRDVPRDLPACHALANIFGTTAWQDANRRQEAA